VEQDRIYRTLGTPLMSTTLETRLGQRPSLADAPELLAVARALDSLGVFSVFLSDDVGGQSAPSQKMLEGVASNGTSDASTSATDPSTLLRPYLLVGLANGRDEGGDFMAVTLLHASEQAASENAEILPRRVEQTSSSRYQKPWRELLGPVESRADGPVMLARLRLKTPQPNLWLSVWISRDSLLWFN
jgi:hypothetical protein